MNVEETSVYQPVNTQEAVNVDVANQTEKTSPAEINVKAKGSFLGFDVSWISTSSSYTKDTFSTAIKDKYGEDIANKVKTFESLGLSKKTGGSTLSLSTVIKARDYAEYLHTTGLGASELPTSESAVSRIEQKQYQAAITVLEKSGLSNRTEPLKTKLAEAMKRENAVGSKDVVLDFKTAEKRVKNAQSEAKLFLKTTIKDALKNVKNDETKKPYTSQEIKKFLEKVSSLFKKELIQQRNKQEWNVITASVITKNLAGQEVKNQTTITPASKMKCLGKVYETGGREGEKIGGVCSGDSGNPDHAVNLWVDRLDAPSAGGDASSSKTKPLLTLVRTGVYCPKTIDPPDAKPAERKDAVEKLEPKTLQEVFDTRFNEALLAAIESKGLLPQQVGGHIDITLTDIGFLSQCKKDEASMQSNQFKLLAGASDKSRTLKYTPPGSSTEITFTVKPTVRALNFGVEWLDEEGVGGTEEPPEWTATNNASLDAILGADNNEENSDAGKFLKALKIKDPNNINSVDYQIIWRLAKQCREMRQSPLSTAADRYAFAARVILLNDMIGNVPCIYCKSGKDRTSRAIEAAKTLAIQIQNSPDGCTVPIHAAGPLSKDDLELRDKVGANSGNQKLQEFNTDMQGNKQYSAFGFLEGLGFLASKLGWGSTATKFYKGLSDFAKT